MDLASAIRTHALESATAGNWSTVADTLSAIEKTSAARECFGVETADALDAVGPRRRAIMTAMQNDPDGRFLLSKLANEGVIWAHPRTVTFMDGLVAAEIMQSQDKAALVALSQPIERPFEGLSATHLEAVWTADKIRNRRKRFDAACVTVRTDIESGSLCSNESIIDAFQTALAGEP